MKNIILSLIAFFTFCISGFAQNWTKEIQKDFRKTKSVAVVIDFSKAKIMGMSYDKFLPYYSEKHYTTEKYVLLMLEQIQDYFKDMLIKEHKLSLCDVEKSKYVIHYDFIEVTENAAAKGVFYVMAGDNKSAEVKFKLSEGRWNDFDVLMKENIKKYFTRVDQELSSDPYINCKLYKNK